jgi:hypothetical protein
MTNQWTPTTSDCGDDSSAPDPAEERGFHIPPKQRNGPAPADIANDDGVRGMPFCPSPTQHASRNGILPTPPVPGVNARIIHGDVHYMPITLRFENQLSNSSIAINAPGRAKAPCPEKLTLNTKPGAGEKPPGLFVSRDSAEKARTSGDSLVVNFEGVE